MTSNIPLFYCDSCTTTIQATLPRIHCLICQDLDLCANCAIGEKLPAAHLAEHSVQVLKESGYGPVIGGAKISRWTLSLAGSNAGQLSQSPPAIPPRPNPYASPFNTNVPQIIPQAGFGWQPFFVLPNMSPTPAYINLANEIFSYLDRGNTGILVPETLSQFLDDMGYAPKDNYWKNGSMANLTVTNPSLQVLAERDHALNLIFSTFSVEHHLLPRPSAGLTPTMPAVTRKGFIDLTSMELLTEPTPQWGYLVQLLRRYNLPSYQRWGELPRSVLPPIPQQVMVDRIANAAAAFTQKANAEKAQVTQAQKELADLRQAQVNTMMGAQIAHQATLESIRQRAFMTTLNSINFQP